MADFSKYLKYQWLTQVPPKHWNVSTLDFLTNNFAEGNLLSLEKYSSIFHHVDWHNKFNHYVENIHSEVRLLFDFLPSEKLSFRQKLEKNN